MTYKELDAYVAEQFGQGADAETVKRALLEAGWSEADVDNALRDVMADAVPVAAVSVHDDIVRMRHAMNDLDRRVRRLETSLAAAPSATLPSGRADVEHALPASRKGRVKSMLLWAVLAAVFVLIGYGGMASFVKDAVTPVTRVWAEAAIGIVLASGGFVTGRMKRRGLANLLTGTGLAFVALATVGAWYLNYIEWSVAVALGGLLLTLALVLGRFYDVWAMRGPAVRTA